MTRARDAAPQSLHTLPRLPFSREEAETIASLAGRDRVMLGLDFEAARARLTKPDVEAPEVLHIATHALIDETQPELSGIVLSLVDARGQPIRGLSAARRGLRSAGARAARRVERLPHRGGRRRAR